MSNISGHMFIRSKRRRKTHSSHISVRWCIIENQTDNGYDHSWNHQQNPPSSNYSYKFTQSHVIYLQHICLLDSKPYLLQLSLIYYYIPMLHKKCIRCMNDSQQHISNQMIRLLLHLLSHSCRNKLPNLMFKNRLIELKCKLSN